MCTRKYLRKEGACYSLLEKALIGSCLYQISCFSLSLAFHHPPGKNFCLHFLNENQLYLDSTTFSPLTFVSRQHCANKTALFALSATDSYQVWLFWKHVYSGAKKEEWDDMDTRSWECPRIIARVVATPGSAPTGG